MWFHPQRIYWLNFTDRQLLILILLVWFLYFFSSRFLCCLFVVLSCRFFFLGAALQTNRAWTCSIDQSIKQEIYPFLMLTFEFWLEDIWCATVSGGWLVIRDIYRNRNHWFQLLKSEYLFIFWQFSEFILYFQTKHSTCQLRFLKCDRWYLMLKQKLISCQINQSIRRRIDNEAGCLFYSLTFLFCLKIWLNTWRLNFSLWFHLTHFIIH